MSYSHHPYALTTVLALSATLTACGGSGGGANDPFVDLHADVNAKEIGALEGSQRLTIKIADHVFTMNDHGMINLDFTRFPEGLHPVDYSLETTAHNKRVDIAYGSGKILRNHYSALFGGQVMTGYDQDGKLIQKPGDDIFSILAVAGLPTAAERIPQGINATYHGRAFAENHDGSFTYHVNYQPNNATGSGKIDFGEHGHVALERANLNPNSRIPVSKDEAEFDMTKPDQAFPAFSGKASYSDGRQGKYIAIPFGPHAEEISGMVKDEKSDEYNIGFGGTR